MQQGCERDIEREGDGGECSGKEVAATEKKGEVVGVLGRKTRRLLWQRERKALRRVVVWRQHFLGSRILVAEVYSIIYISRWHHPLNDDTENGVLCVKEKKKISYFSKYSTRDIFISI